MTNPKAAFASFGRVLAATLFAAVVAVWNSTPDRNVLAWDVAGWRAFALAVASAAMLTVINALRPSDTRFGRGATDLENEGL